MKNKRLKILFRKNFKEEIAQYLPGTKVYGLPNDYTLRILYILLMYGFYTVMGLATFSLLAFSYLSKNDEYSYFLSASLIISIFTIILSAVDLRLFKKQGHEYFDDYANKRWRNLFVKVSCHSFIQIWNILFLYFDDFGLFI